jgi:sugar phosphate permease
MWNPLFSCCCPGYFLSYLFRTINALISAQLTAELGLSAAGLSLLTSVYFLTFAAAQLPDWGLARLLRTAPGADRFVTGGSAGAALFGLGRGIVPLVFARGLIGLGVAAALAAPRAGSVQ